MKKEGGAEILSHGQSIILRRRTAKLATNSLRRASLCLAVLWRVLSFALNERAKELHPALVALS